nr:hypothetical protein [Tanacetum cinerariifolium]
MDGELKPSNLLTSRQLLKIAFQGEPYIVRTQMEQKDVPVGICGISTWGVGEKGLVLFRWVQVYCRGRMGEKSFGEKCCCGLLSIVFILYNEKPEVNATELKARRVNGRIKCNLIGHVYRAKAQVISSPARERNQSINTHLSTMEKWDLYALLEDAQEGRTRISQRVAIYSQRFDLLIKDMIAHQETMQIVEEEAYASREAWAHSMGLSQAFHSALQTHREQVYAYEFQLHAHQTQLQLQGTLIQTQHQVHETCFRMQQAEMAELKETDPLREHRRRARQPGSDARAPDHQEASRDADSHI